MTPIVDGLEAEFMGHVSVVRLDADESVNAQVQTRYGVRGHPSFAVLDSEGVVTQRLLGPQTAGALREGMVAVQE